MPLNPMPISASAPAGSYHGSAAGGMKRGRGRPVGFASLPQHKIEFESVGKISPNFLPFLVVFTDEITCLVYGSLLYLGKDWSFTVF